MTPNDDMDDVRRAYRDARDAAPDDAPPAALDDAIRAAARRAVHSRPQPAGQGWITRWRTPLSAAAVMMLAVSVVFVAIEEKPDVAPAAVQKAALELREAVPVTMAKKDAQGTRTDSMALQERAPLQTKIVAADSPQQVSPPEVQMASPALPREKKAMQSASGAMTDNMADHNAAPRAEEAARNRAVAVAKEKSSAGLSAERRDVALAPPPAQSVAPAMALLPPAAPAPAAPPAPPAPMIAFAPPPPAVGAAVPAAAPSRAMASAPASTSAPVVSNTSLVMVAEGAKLSEAAAKQARQEPAKPAEAAEARYTAAARQAAKAEAASGALPPPAAPSSVAAQAAVVAKDRVEKITVTGSVVAPPVYAPAVPPVKALVEQKESADAWIKRIEQLMKDNKLKDVREELVRFRKAHPNVTLPPALAQLPPE